MPLSSLRVPMLPEHKTCPAFAQSITAKNTSDVLDRSSPLRRVRWTPDFGRPDKVELPGWEAPYQEQDDGRKATSIWGSLQGEGGTSGSQGRPDYGTVGEPIWRPHQPGDGLEEAAHGPGGRAVRRRAAAAA